MQIIYHGDLMDSCLLRGIPSTSSKPSSSECLLSLIDEPSKHVKEDNINNHVLRWQDSTRKCIVSPIEGNLK
jgi:hypothetical protein